MKKMTSDRLFNNLTQNLTIMGAVLISELFGEFGTVIVLTVCVIMSMLSFMLYFYTKSMDKNKRHLD